MQESTCKMLLMAMIKPQSNLYGTGLLCLSVKEEEMFKTFTPCHGQKDMDVILGRNQNLKYHFS